jgi:hypothetical protein
MSYPKQTQHNPWHAAPLAPTIDRDTCNDRETDLCGGGLLERPRYFPRQLITPADLNLEAAYFRAKLRRHNRLLHGWGVVCGARVCTVNPPSGGVLPWQVMVTPGYVLGPYGDEIVIAAERTVDLRSSGASGICGDIVEGAISGEQRDPWCSDVMIDRRQSPLWIAVRYTEMKTRPVRTQPAGCGCDDESCEFSRWCDGYEISFLDCCPRSQLGQNGSTTGRQSMPTASASPYRNAAVTGQSEGGAWRPLLECPECPIDPWVVLARIEFETDGRITVIDNCDCRRLVISHANEWWTCTDQPLRINCDSISVARQGEAVSGQNGPFQPGDTIVVTAQGGYFAGIQESDVDFGPGVTITDVELDSNTGQFTITATIDRYVEPRCRALTVTGRGCATVGCANVFCIEPAPETKGNKGNGSPRRRRQQDQGQSQ